MFLKIQNQLINLNLVTSINKIDVTLSFEEINEIRFYEGNGKYNSAFFETKKERDQEFNNIEIKLIKAGSML